MRLISAPLRILGTRSGAVLLMVMCAAHRGTETRITIRNGETGNAQKDAHSPQRPRGAWQEPVVISHAVHPFKSVPSHIQSTKSGRVPTTVMFVAHRGMETQITTHDGAIGSVRADVHSCRILHTAPLGKPAQHPAVIY